LTRQHQSVYSEFPLSLEPDRVTILICADHTVAFTTCQNEWITAVRNGLEIVNKPANYSLDPVYSCEGFSTRAGFGYNVGTGFASFRPTVDDVCLVIRWRVSGGDPLTPHGDLTLPPRDSAEKESLLSTNAKIGIGIGAGVLVVVIVIVVILVCRRKGGGVSEASV
jgi:tetrahydromethanopterin S-methyltransferase subunit B